MSKTIPAIPAKSSRWLALVLLLASFVVRQQDVVSVVQGFSSDLRHSRTASFTTTVTGKRRSGWLQQHFLSKRLEDTEESIGSVIQTKQPKPQQAVQKCQFCSQSFPSRNALFRHLASTSTCSSFGQNLVDNSSINIRSKAPPVLKRYAMALLLGYHESKISNHTNEKTTITATSSEAERAGVILLQALESFLNQSMDPNAATTPDVRILSCTQSSIARMRHKVLSQEEGCAGAGDVMVVSWKQHDLGTLSSQDETAFLSRLLDHTQQYLEMNSPKGLQVRLQACKWLDEDYHLHAERACTQRVYHYLLPVSWLPHGEDIRDWWLGKNNVPPFSDQHSTKRMHEEHPGPTSRIQPPPESLQRFKHVLRQVESVPVWDRSIDMKKQAAGRFGTMARRERRAWHNYADPTLQGDASPNNEPIWRVIDRARIVQFLVDEQSDNPNNNNTDVIAVLEFRGDEFMPQQIRRIVGTLVAIAHGWLPNEMLNVSTCASHFLETPLAPSGRLYLAGLRFHFDEMRTLGKSLFESDMIGRVVTRRKKDDGVFDYLNDVAWVQHLLLQDIQHERLSTLTWLDDLRAVVAPRVRHQLARLTTSSLDETKTSGQPGCHARTSCRIHLHTSTPARNCQV